MNRAAQDSAARQAAAGSVVGAHEGEPLDFAGVRGRVKVDGRASEGRFVLAHFAELPPHHLAAPLHRHSREDEFTLVIAGELSVQVGDRIVTAARGDCVHKPRGEWHTFWNAGDTPCSTVEVVSPAGFEEYFREVAALDGDMRRLDAINQRFGIDMDLGSVPVLCERHRLRFASPGR